MKTALADILLCLGILLVVSPAVAAADTTVVSDTTWRARNPQPPTGWNTDLVFDDSDAAGWQNAVGNTTGNRIWYQSLKSASAPSNAWFRHVFTLDQAATAATATLNFDDNGEAYLNGHLLVEDSGGGASTFNLTIDPSWFTTGDNLIAVHGIDTIAPDCSIGVRMTVTTVPEPAALTVLAAGLPLLAARRRRSR